MHFCIVQHLVCYSGMDISLKKFFTNKTVYNDYIFQSNSFMGITVVRETKEINAVSWH